MKEKSENRKALPKFLATLLIAGLGGGVIGFFVGLANVFGLDAAGFAAGVSRTLQKAVPWGSPVCILLFGCGVLWLYRAAGRKAAAWDGGDESDASREAEDLLSWTMLLSGMQLLTALFFFAAAVHYQLPHVLYHVAVLFLSCGTVIFAQQKAVDLTKRMNPEKRGSVYDKKFQKTWLESCDESERRQIGQAAYQAFLVTSRLCLWLWVGLMVLNMVFDFGLMPIAAVLLVLGVMQGTYGLACIRLGKKGRLKGAAEN